MALESIRKLTPECSGIMEYSGALLIGFVNALSVANHRKVASEFIKEFQHAQSMAIDDFEEKGTSTSIHIFLKIFNIFINFFYTYIRFCEEPNQKILRTF